MAPGGPIDWVTGRSCSLGSAAGTLLNVQKGQRKGSEKRVAWRSSSVAVRDRGHWNVVCGKRMGTVRDFGQEAPDGWKGGRPWVLVCRRGARTKTISALCCLRAIQGHFGGIPMSPELMNCAFIPYKCKEYNLSHKNFVEFSIHFGVE